MKRHDTHLLTDESEKENLEEDEHKYNFDNSLNSSSDNSQDKYFSIESCKKGPAYVNFLKLNNISNNFTNKEIKDKDTSIISTKELEDIFYVENNADNNNKIFTNKKKKRKKNKYFIRLRKIKLNDDEIIYNCLTYNPSLRNEIIDKKIKIDNSNNINKYRNCISLTDINKNNKKYDRNKLKNRLSTNSLKEKEVLYFFYNDDYEGNKRLKNVINIINKQKLKFLQVSSHNFTIKTMKPNINNISKSSSRFPVIYKKNNNFQRELKIRKYKNNNNNNNNFNKAQFLSSSKVKRNEETNFAPNKSNQLLLKNNKSSIDILKYNLRKTPNQSMSFKTLYNNNNNYKNSNKKKVGKRIFDIYQDNHKKRIPSVKSAGTSGANQKMAIRVKMDIYKEHKKYNDIQKSEKENRKLIEKLYKIQTGFGTNASNQYIYYNRHFGNNENCPLCQAIEQKNEENIKKMGIHHLIPNQNNENNIQNSWQSRRVYSALSRILNRKQKNNFETRSKSRSKSKSISKSRSKSRSKNKNINKNILLYREKSQDNINKNSINHKTNNNCFLKKDMSHVRKLGINKSICRQTNYSTIQKFTNTKNKSMKFV